MGVRLAKQSGEKWRDGTAEREALLLVLQIIVTGVQEHPAAVSV